MKTTLILEAAMLIVGSGLAHSATFIVDGIRCGSSSQRETLIIANA
jgi:hypothetical protein